MSTEDLRLENDTHPKLSHPHLQPAAAQIGYRRTFIFGMDSHHDYTSKMHEGILNILQLNQAMFFLAEMVS